MLAGKSRAIKVASADSLPFPSSARPGSAGQGGTYAWQIQALQQKKCLMGGARGEHGSGKAQPGLIAAAIRLAESRDLAHWRPNPA